MKTIVCTKPGMRRAGVEHPGRKDWADDAFTDAQWAAIDADPAFVVFNAADQSSDALDIDPARLADIAAAIALVPEGATATVKAVSELAGFKVSGAEIKAAQDAAAAQQ